MCRDNAHLHLPRSVWLSLPFRSSICIYFPSSKVLTSEVSWLESCWWKVFIIFLFCKCLDLSSFFIDILLSRKLHVGPPPWDIVHRAPHVSWPASGGKSQTSQRSVCSTTGTPGPAVCSAKTVCSKLPKGWLHFRFGVWWCHPFSHCVAEAHR